MANARMPFALSDFKVDLKSLDINTFLFEIDFPRLNSSLLADRIFIMIHLEDSMKIKYFTMEKSFGNQIMLSEIFMTNDKSLSRINYGPVPDDREIQIKRVIEIFNEY